MAKKKSVSSTQEDTTVIKSSYTAAVKSYAPVGTIRVSDLLQSFDGNVGKLARSLTGLSQEGKLPAKGTQERTNYDTQRKNIGRWLAYESGIRGKNARNPENKTTQDRLATVKEKPDSLLTIAQEQALASNPPSSMNITISGLIGYDDDFRQRTISINAPTYKIDVAKFLDAMRAGDTHKAYREVFAPYAKALSVAHADSIDITFS